MDIGEEQMETGKRKKEESFSQSGLCSLASNFQKLSFAFSYLSGGWWRKIVTGNPIFVTLFVTARCPYRCPHCFYRGRMDKTGGVDELSEMEFEKIAAGMPSFPKLLIGGGEPFLRDDIVRICRYFITRCGVKQLIIPSNGFDPERLEKAAGELLDMGKLFSLEFQLSLDGVGEKHDKIRGSSGAFDRVIESFQRLKRLSETYPELDVRFNYTISSLNQENFEETFRYVKEKLGVDRMGMTLTRGEAFDPSTKNVDPENYNRAAQLASGGETSLLPGFLGRLQGARVDLERKTIFEITRSQNTGFRCLSGLLSAIIDEQGEVKICEMLPDSFGNLRQANYEFRRIWHGNNARQFRRRLACGKCQCTFETAVRMSLTFDIKSWWKIFYMALKYGRIA